jgi:DNA-binding NarL/FixJ family response regulator
MCSLQAVEALEADLMRILLVEDSALIRDAIVDTLSGNAAIQFDGFAATQEEAISLLNERSFDLLLVDIELAKGNGFEVLKTVKKEDYSYPPPVCIMLTNHAYSHYRQQAQTLGVDYFFDKSMDFDLAIETIEIEAAKHAQN